MARQAQKTLTTMRLEEADTVRLAALAQERRTSSSALAREFIARGLEQEERLLATARFERVLQHLKDNGVPDDTIAQAKAIYFDGGALAL